MKKGETKINNIQATNYFFIRENMIYSCRQNKSKIFEVQTKEKLQSFLQSEILENKFIKGSNLKLLQVYLKDFTLKSLEIIENILYFKIENDKIFSNFSFGFEAIPDYLSKENLENFKNIDLPKKLNVVIINKDENILVKEKSTKDLNIELVKEFYNFKILKGNNYQEYKDTIKKGNYYFSALYALIDNNLYKIDHFRHKESLNSIIDRFNDIDYYKSIIDDFKKFFNIDLIFDNQQEQKPKTDLEGLSENCQVETKIIESETKIIEVELIATSPTKENFNLSKDTIEFIKKSTFDTELSTFTESIPMTTEKIYKWLQNNENINSIIKDLEHDVLLFDENDPDIELYNSVIKELKQFSNKNNPKQDRIVDICLNMNPTKENYIDRLRQKNKEKQQKINLAFRKVNTIAFSLANVACMLFVLFNINLSKFDNLLALADQNKQIEIIQQQVKEVSNNHLEGLSENCHVPDENKTSQNYLLLLPCLVGTLARKKELKEEHGKDFYLFVYIFEGLMKHLPKEQILVTVQEYEDYQNYAYYCNKFIFKENILKYITFIKDENKAV